MKTNPKIFKAYDIRGIYGQDLDEETAYLLGKAYVELRRRDGKMGKLSIVVAEDMRLSSPQLKTSLAKGLTDAGANVIDIGLASTPTFYFAVANYHYDGGIIVSASHNPAEWNGFKMVREKAIPISGETGIFFLRDKIINGDFKAAEHTGQVLKRKKSTKL